MYKRQGETRGGGGDAEQGGNGSNAKEGDNERKKSSDNSEAEQGGNDRKESSDSSDVRKGGKRVALAFYGLTRSLKYTFASVQQNIFAPLEAAGHTYDVYLHTYDLETLSNARSGEDETALNTTEWRLLQPDVHAITRQVRTMAS